MRIPLLVMAAAALMALALAAPANADVVYANAPVAGAAELPSSSFEETGTAELGSLVRLGGAARLDPTVRVEMTTAAGAPAEPFSAQVTLSVYAPSADREPGTLLARQTESFEFAAGPGVQPVRFSLTGLTLPDEAILSVASTDDSLAVALAGPPAAGANPREAEGLYRAASSEGAAGPFGFEPYATGDQTLQPAFTVEADPAVVAPAPAVPASTPAAPRTFRREYSIPPSKRMSVSFPRPTARIAGPGALVQVRCTGSSAARCIGTLSLETAGIVHKAPFSISKGRKQYVVVPLGQDLEHLDALAAPRATATASTVQLGGAAVKTKRALRLK